MLQYKSILLKLIIVLMFIFSVQMLSATWSIVAVDPETGEVGSAGASYTPAVWPILGINGGIGVVVAQAASNEAGRLKALEMMNQGRTPDEIIKVISSSDFDKLFEHQQYGIATLKYGSIAYTGARCTEWAGHDSKEYVSIQANIMASDHVVSDAMAAFASARQKGLPLTDRLMAALLAGSKAGGDSRAGEDTAMTAYLAVAKPEDPPGKPSFAIIIPPQGKGINPVEILETKLAELKGSDHPMYFPSLMTLVTLLIVLPLISGLLITIVISLICRNRKICLMNLKILGISGFSAVIVYYIMAGLCLILSWAAPVYGMYSWLVPTIIVCLNSLLFGIVRFVFLIVNKVGKGKPGFR